MKLFKKIIGLVIITLLFGSFKKDPIVKLTHTGYIAYYNTDLHYSVNIEWWDTRARLVCPESKIPRKDAFAPDPLLPAETDLMDDYKGSGFDRGHMCPAADNQCSSELQKECFYFSNMSPQYHSLNAGIWKTLESRTRELTTEFDSVKVWCGSLGSAGKIGTVTIPTHCWKVIFIKKTKVWEAYLFENTKVQPKDLESKLTPLSKIETITRIKFK